MSGETARSIFLTRATGPGVQQNIMAKRVFDIVAAAFGLVLFSPVLFTAALLVKASSPGPVFFKQQRIGRYFKPFLIYKYRTMYVDAAARGTQLTVGRDPRITPAGHWLRRTKIDELPQLVNVLKGDMSLVGPRPEVPYYVELFRSDYQEILRVRPGLTDLASLKYSDEAALLGKAENPEEEYIRHLLPDKIELAKEYLRRSSFFFDIRLILDTAIKFVGYRMSSLSG
jgi:lipopolysaccharide/colanic/teichoic acid biosynthesis glycosyltransferase